ncbi:Glutathione peroxidase 3 [Liparis tanakae]|uniref:glutathione peroxidase n=1 Tax=Liparis tanakae TaxID=230148 RepID=A0A4Z2EIB0_9TELE|nr:Glutathione peroxidase 3 [Liparis tanakae]
MSNVLKVKGQTHIQVAPWQCEPTNETIYRFSSRTLVEGRSVELSDFKGQSVLFINYGELNALHEQLKHLGFTVLGYPCNQFGKQEPGQRHEILPGIKHVRPGNGFVPNFPMFEKGDVNGKEEQGVFTFLKASCPPVGDLLGDPARMFWSPMKLGDIKWNFEKFLVGPDGVPVMRWHPSIRVSAVRADILRHLQEQRRAPG